MEYYKNSALPASNYISIFVVAAPQHHHSTTTDCVTNLHVLVAFLADVLDLQFGAGIADDAGVLRQQFVAVQPPDGRGRSSSWQGHPAEKRDGQAGKLTADGRLILSS